jgi:L-seryl-tRNA(Ser) seleniumtransferase
VDRRQSTSDELTERLRALPSVERLAGELAQGDGGALAGPDRVTIAVAREVVERRRARLLAGEDADGDVLAEARRALAQARRPGPSRVINATGVIVHTNLGRAPLARAAREAAARVADGYSDLELDLPSGARGSRQAHVCALLRALTGAEDALAVNNGAGAVLLAAATLAGPGRSVIVSRGQLIEIGGSFRIPEVIAASGSRLVEVGTTNRTRVEDYERALAGERALGREVGAILRAHPSNFRSLGFVEEVSVAELCRLGVPVIDDAGSGALVPTEAEPVVPASVAAGAALVCFSGDKLLGGPQAGLLVGTAEAVSRAARHPLARALRIDKLSLAALAATLALHRDPEQARREIPVLAMLDAPPAELGRRAAALVAALAAGGLVAEVVAATARVGGGALPLLELEGPAVRIEPTPTRAGGADAAAAALRRGEPPVLVRISEGALLLDPRTMTDADGQAAAGAVLAALSR